jgi:hypothetical protein
MSTSPAPALGLPPNTFYAILPALLGDTAPPNSLYPGRYALEQTFPSRVAFVKVSLPNYPSAQLTFWAGIHGGTHFSIGDNHFVATPIGNLTGIDFIDDPFPGQIHSPNTWAGLTVEASVLR